MPWCRALAIVLLTGGGAASAQTMISPDTFLDRATGKTLNFYLLGTENLVGIEQFLRRDLSVWKPVGGDCVYGKIVTDDRKICFHYDGYPNAEENCWVPFRDGEQLFVRTDRLLNPETHYVGEISERQIACENAPTS
ncbi:hypothetical protein CLV88_101350 [Shimia abyssi]|uniref:Uncharacterized protein n=2 Tax=Shimia abyssi TaxID=1662395 RepID=A0A2P8FJM4_9RHOB|nr:hypothetical protein CLV88_101350 [Shimia abyssi]